MSDKKIRVAIIGQPNTGKSSLFTRLTGVGVISSNYPGTTVEFEESSITRLGNTVVVHDLPGVYSLIGNSADENVAIRMLKENNDAVIVVADASSLESSIVLCFEVIELGLPAVLALNKYDIARKKVDIDIEALETILGIKVMAVSAKTSEGVDALADYVCNFKAGSPNFKVKYDKYIEDSITELSPLLPSDSFDKRGMALKLLEGSEEFSSNLSDYAKEMVKVLRMECESVYSEDAAVLIGRGRYSFADVIVRKIVQKTHRKPTLGEKISDAMIEPITGFPILLGVMFAVFVSIITFGSLLDEAVSGLYETFVGTAIVDFGRMIGGDFGYAVFAGIDGSIQAILGLIIPYIMVFYILLGILEDSGYLPRAVILLDRIMHIFGLHGGAFIPMLVGVGCNVPAIMATRSVPSHRERLILCSMIVMAVPCSAQMAIVFGATGNFAGMLAAFGILLVLVALLVITGVLMNKLMVKEPSNLAMELPELVIPQPRNILFKMWYRIKDFFVMAFPLLVIGSIIVEILIVFDLLDPLVEPLAFITTGMLGLPAVLIISFIVGILRKEMALGMLVILAGPVALEDFLTPDQFIVFGLVMAIYMPCLATIVAMGRELGWKDTGVISVLSILVALLLGTACNYLLQIF